MSSTYIHIGLPSDLARNGANSAMTCMEFANVGIDSISIGPYRTDSGKTGKVYWVHDLFGDLELRIYEGSPEFVELDEERKAASGVFVASSFTKWLNMLAIKHGNPEDIFDAIIRHGKEWQAAGRTENQENP